MCPAVNILTSVLLLILGGLRGAAASDLQVYGKSIHRDKTLLSSDYGRHTVRKQPHQQTKSEIRKSLDPESFNEHVRPTTSRISLPTIIKLHPPTAKPLHKNANMPMRFGRENIPGDKRAANSSPNMPMRFGRENIPADERAPNSSPNMPQRFGRSWDVIHMCAKCPDVLEAQLPQRFGRSSAYWSLLRILANAQLLNTGLHWAHVFDFTTSSEVVDMP